VRGTNPTQRGGNTYVDWGEGGGIILSEKNYRVKEYFVRLTFENWLIGEEEGERNVGAREGIMIRGLG